MAETRWKLVVDQQGMTISNDRFHLVTETTSAGGTGSFDDMVSGVDETGQMETIISELEAMTKRSYGQFCGLSRALELVGERWAMFIVRDLLVAPKTFSELRHGLPRVSTDVLIARLRELEHSGVIQRLVPPGPQDLVRYELTEYGTELDEVTLKLGLWGARLLGEPRPEEIVTTSSLIMAMRATFQPAAAAGLKASYEIRMGDIVFHLKIDDGALIATPGPLSDADMRIEPGMALKDLLTGDVSPAQAEENGVVFTGDPALLKQFVQFFRIVAPPSHA